MKSISPAQCRAARALLTWSQDDLATACRVAKSTIANFEAGNRSPYERTLEDVRQAFENAGIEFSGDSGVEISCRIAASIGTLAMYVRRSARMMVMDVPRLATEDEISNHEKNVLSICEKLDDLAQRSRVEDTRYREFEELRLQLSNISAFPRNDHVSAVASAFFEAGRLDG